MRFMTLWRPARNAKPPSSEEMGKLIVEMTKAGALVETGGWNPTSPATVLKNSNGKVSVTDGPYAETKELIAGFALIEVKSKEEATEWGIRFLKIAGEGTSEMRPLGDYGSS